MSRKTCCFSVLLMVQRANAAVVCTRRSFLTSDPIVAGGALALRFFLSSRGPRVVPFPYKALTKKSEADDLAFDPALASFG